MVKHVLSYRFVSFCHSLTCGVLFGKTKLVGYWGVVGSLSVHTCQVPHQVDSYFGFNGRQQLGKRLPLLLPGWDAGLQRG